MTLLLALFARLGLAQRLRHALPYIGCGLAVALLCGALWWRGDHYRNQRDHEHATVLEFKAASALAEAAALKAKADAELRYQQGADHADQEHATALADAQRRTDAFIAQHRVQLDRARPTGQTAGPAQGGSAGISAPPADTTELARVSVPERDVTTCTGNYVYAKAAYDWAKGLSDAAHP